MVRDYNYINLLEEKIELKGLNIIIWGISETGISLYLQLTKVGANVIAFTDSYYKGENDSLGGVPIINYRKIKDMDAYIFISTKNPNYLRKILMLTDELSDGRVLAYGTIYGAGLYDSTRLKTLIENDRAIISEVRNNLADQRSVDVFDLLIKYRTENNEELLEEAYESGHMQYFPEKDIINLTPNEVFVDAGAYNGETSIAFANNVDGKYRKIYAMEPDPVMCKLMRDYIYLKGINNISCVNLGAYSHSTKLMFNMENASGSSCISGEGSVEIETISIDEMLDGNEATYIKMDIEGSELEALEGCKNTILKYKPKLAISVYHKEDDLWKIPAYILEKYPFYRLYLRHYTPITTETILYAKV